MFVSWSDAQKPSRLIPHPSAFPISVGIFRSLSLAGALHAGESPAAHAGERGGGEGGRGGEGGGRDTGASSRRSLVGASSP